jgi:hypothetical protein
MKLDRILRSRPVNRVAAQEVSGVSGAPVCDTCLGHRYRVKIDHGITVNAEAAMALKITGEKVRCENCRRQPKVVAANTMTPSEQEVQEAA